MTTAGLLNSTSQTYGDQVHEQHPRQTPLFDERESHDLRTRWQAVRRSFCWFPVPWLPPRNLRERKRRPPWKSTLDAAMAKQANRVIKDKNSNAENPG